MKQPRRLITIIGMVAMSALVSPLAGAQDSSDNRAAQAWRNFQQKTQDNFRQTQQRMHDAMSHVQITPAQSFSEAKGQ
jgi:hypothetical protein